MMCRLLFVKVVFLSTIFIKDGESACNMTDDVCEFWFNVEHKMTMMDYKKAVYPENGELYHYDVTNTSAAEPVKAPVIQADGWEDSRLVVVVNNQMPGPAVEVYEDQTVIVHVKNLLHSEAVTVHWHGLHQPGTPWMDGVAFITQCPIQPGQTFTYQFKAKPKGTFWYHSHIGSQRSMGLLGPLIVREKKALEMEEFILTIQDWNHDWVSDMVYQKMAYGMYINRKKLSASKSLDGSFFSMFRFQSGLINGKGRYYDESRKHNGAPLEKFMVEKGKKYRFRVIAAGNLYPFRISVDDHDLSIVASDGYDLKPQTAESFIINPGERMDFVLHANKNVSNFWIRGKTLEHNMNHTAEAILRYKGAPEEEPSSTRKTCSADDKCVIVNCPFTYYPDETNTKCIRFDQLKSKEDDPAPTASPGKFSEYFLNFAFPGIKATPASVNGRAFVNPPVSSLTQPAEISPLCEDVDCGEDKICHCSHSLYLNHGDVIQMVFLNMGLGKGWAHPIHMHGHSFYVLKMGYPTYNKTTGKNVEDNLDIDCRGNPDRKKSFCNNATWRNQSWLGGNVPDMELSNPPRKDTIIVPSGGYVVVRIRADNPGVWFMHCHIELHSSDGMALMINESFPHHPPPPKGFPRCNSFGPDIKYTGPENKTEKPEKVETEDMIEKKVFWIVVGCLIGLAVLQFFVIAYYCCTKTTKDASHPSKKYETAAENKGYIERM